MPRTARLGSRVRSALVAATALLAPATLADSYASAATPAAATDVLALTVTEQTPLAGGGVTVTATATAYTDATDQHVDTTDDDRLSLTSGDPTLQLATAAPLTLQAGQVTFTATLTTPGTQTVAVADADAPRATSADTTVAVAAATTGASLAFATAPATVSAGTTRPLWVLERDGLGDIDANLGDLGVAAASGSVGAPAADGTCTSATLASTATVALSSVGELAGGVAELCYQAPAGAGTDTVTVTDGQLTATYDADVVTPSASASPDATALTVVAPSGTPQPTAGSGEIAVDIEATTADGLTPDGFAGSVTADGDPITVTDPTGATVVALTGGVFVQGSAAFVLVAPTKAGTASVDVTDPAPSAPLTAHVAVAVQPGPGARLTVADPGTVLAGASTTLAVTTGDFYGNRVAADTTSAVTGSSSEGASATVGSATPSAGVAQVPVTLDVAGSATVTLQSTNATAPFADLLGVAVPLTVDPGPIASLRSIGTTAASYPATTAQSFTFAAFDAEGNAVDVGPSLHADRLCVTTDDAGASVAGTADPACAGGRVVTLALSGAAPGTATATITFGQVASSVSVTASDVDRSPVAASTPGFAVVAGPAATLAFSAPPTVATADRSFAVAVVLQDAAGNEVTSGPAASDPFTLSSSDPAEQSAGAEGSGMLRNGVGAGIAVLHTTPGPQQLTVTDTAAATAVAPTSVSVRVVPVGFVVTVPSTVTAGVPFEVDVQAVDSTAPTTPDTDFSAQLSVAGLATGDPGAATAATSGGPAVSSVTMSAGRATFYETLTVAAAGQAITVADTSNPGIAGTSAAFAVAAAAPITAGLAGGGDVISVHPGSAPTDTYTVTVGGGRPLAAAVALTVVLRAPTATPAGTASGALPGPGAPHDYTCPPGFAATTPGEGAGCSLTVVEPQGAAVAPVAVTVTFDRTAHAAPHTLEVDASLAPVGATGVPVDVAVHSVRSTVTDTFPPGLLLLGADGGIFSLGSAPFYGSAGNLHLHSPMRAVATTPSGHGYWTAAADGGVFSYGDAGFFGSLGSITLNRPVVGMAATPDGRGYWLVAADGGVFAFGDAPFHGSTGDLRLALPIVGIVATADGRGYWMVASDGGVFAFGDAPYVGSLPATCPSCGQRDPIVGISPAPDGHGYWIASRSGGVFTYGSASFAGNGIGRGLQYVAIAGNVSGSGYWLLATSGAVVPLGAPALGGVPTPAAPLVAMVGT